MISIIVNIYWLEQQISITMADMTIILGVVIGVVVVGLAFNFLVLGKSRSRKQRLQVTLVEAKQLTHDTIVFTFTLPNQASRLGLKIGEHIEIEQNIKGEIVKRKYTPISPIDRVGSFQLLLKIYRPTEQFPNGGKMSCFLADLPLNSKITITLPFGRFNYLGKSSTQITDFEGQTVRRRYKNLYMVTGGTGITPIFQIIQYCCDKESQQQRPKLFLLFANRTENDILMQDILTAYAEKNYSVKIYYSVDNSVTSSWEGFKGFISEDMIRKTYPEAQVKDTLFMSCGPPPMCNNVEKIWKSLNVPATQIYRF